ncbi:MAG: NAD(P)-dependent glycerol-3-phosphate dehydrogenase [Candidatus Aureabacteria bacterium]|nr:NAD(P)-dependent glycerol-3-phosphate dehydrogenase [Candidatus Auribacterota bacterium]
MANKIAILGSGSWGTALGSLLKGNGHPVALWDYYPQVLDYIRKNGHPKFLPNLTMTADEFQFCYDIKDALAASDYIITAIPTQNYHLLFAEIGQSLPKDTKIINCSKGIDVKTKHLIYQMFQEELQCFHKDNYAVLSGPSYAEEVVKQIPTAIVVASHNPILALEIQKLLCNSWFRVYSNGDVLGVELSGAVKNIIAIASGICDGIGYGVNTRAALITRGNAEIMRLGKAMGAKSDTFMGLAGIGDLMLTAMSDLSRNYRLGFMIGTGKKMEDALNEIGMVVEGVETVKSTKQLAKQYGIEMPIVDKVFQTLFEDLSPHHAVIELMTRDLKSE